MRQALLTEAARHANFKQQLLAEFPDLDDDTLADTLEGLTSLHEILAAVIRSALEDEALTDALGQLIANMRARRDRLEKRSQAKRALALACMADGGPAKLLAPDFTASVQSGAPSLELIAEDEIPAAYWKPQPPKLDKVGLLAALKSGTIIDGVALVQGKPQLTVRTK